MNDAESALIEAVTRRDRHAVETALAEGASASARTHDGYPVLMLAARDGERAIVERLLSADADPGQLRLHYPPNCIIVVNGGLRYMAPVTDDMPREEIERIRAELQHRATVLHDGDPDSLYPDRSTRPAGLVPANALSVAAAERHDDVLTSLLAVPCRPKDISLALSCAASTGALAACRALLEAGATAAHGGIPPLHAAARHGRLVIVEFLLSAGLDPEYQDDEGETAIHEAARGGHVEIIRCLLDHGADADRGVEGEYPLMSAAYHGHRAAFEVLRPRCKDPRLVREAERELSDALDTQERRSAVLANAKTLGFIDTVIHDDRARFDSTIGQPGIDVDGFDEAGNTALIYASRRASSYMVDALLRAGADPRTKTQGGFGGRTGGTTAVMAALEVVPFGVELAVVEPVIRRLVDAGAELEVEDDDGMTVLGRLRQRAKVLRVDGYIALLEELGATR